MAASYVLQHYIQAFKTFSKASDKTFEYRQRSNGVYFLWNDETYVVSHSDDILTYVKTHFEEASFLEISLNMDSSLWDLLINNELGEVSLKDWLISIYRAWKAYWEVKTKDYTGGKEEEDRMRRRSWEDLMVLFEIIQLEPDKIAESAKAIDEELLPVIAMAIKNQYDSEEAFYSEVTNHLTTYGDQLLTMGGIFESVEVPIEGDKVVEEFFVYNPLHTFQNNIAN